MSERLILMLKNCAKRTFGVRNVTVNAKHYRKKMYMDKRCKTKKRCYLKAKNMYKFNRSDCNRVQMNHAYRAYKKEITRILSKRREDFVNKL